MWACRVKNWGWPGVVDVVDGVTVLARRRVVRGESFTSYQGLRSD